MYRNDNNDLIVFFNVYCWAKKTANDASDMESILRDEFSLVNSATFGTKIPEKQSLYFDGITVDQSDIEVKGMHPGKPSNFHPNHRVSSNVLLFQFVQQPQQPMALRATARPTTWTMTAPMRTLRSVPLRFPMMIYSHNPAAPSPKKPTRNDLLPPPVDLHHPEVWTTVDVCPFPSSFVVTCRTTLRPIQIYWATADHVTPIVWTKQPSEQHKIPANQRAIKWDDIFFSR